MTTPPTNAGNLLAELWTPDLDVSDLKPLLTVLCMSVEVLGKKVTELEAQCKKLDSKITSRDRKSCE